MRYYTEMTWPEWQAMDRATTVIFVPFSPMEEHGPHLPIGTDLLTAQHLVDVCARRIEAVRPDVTAVLAPPVPLGAGTIPLPGTVNISGDLVFEVAVQMASAFARDGFRFIVFSTGHMGGWHLLALENAAKVVSKRFGIHCVAPSAMIARNLILRRQMAATLAEEMSPEELEEFQRATHSGMLETSVMLAAYPNLVQSSYRDLPRLSRTAIMRWRGRRRTTNWQGYVGDPSRARAEWGKLAIDGLSESCIQLLVGLLDNDQQIAHTAHILPRVPYWMAVRPLRMVLAAAMIGAGITFMAGRVLGGRMIDNG
jgi:creatinine amidohydrolase